MPWSILFSSECKAIKNSWNWKMPREVLHTHQCQWIEPKSYWVLVTPHFSWHHYLSPRWLSSACPRMHNLSSQEVDMCKPPRCRSPHIHEKPPSERYVRKSDSDQRLARYETSPIHPKTLLVPGPWIIVQSRNAFCKQVFLADHIPIHSDFDDGTAEVVERCSIDWSRSVVEATVRHWYHGPRWHCDDEIPSPWRWWCWWSNLWFLVHGQNDLARPNSIVISWRFRNHASGSDRHEVRMAKSTWKRVENLHIPYRDMKSTISTGRHSRRMQLQSKLSRNATLEQSAFAIFNESGMTWSICSDG